MTLLKLNLISVNKRALLFKLSLPCGKSISYLVLYKFFFAASSK